jgi:hypothetical protein
MLSGQAIVVKRLIGNIRVLPSCCVSAKPVAAAGGSLKLSRRRDYDCGPLSYRIPVLAQATDHKRAKGLGLMGEREVLLRLERAVPVAEQHGKS